MKEQNNIDRLFQDRLKDFESMPDEHVWQNIEASLDKKKKKRRGIIPLWFRYGGVAAILILAVWFGYDQFSNDSFPQQEIVVEEENPSLPEINNNQQNTEIVEEKASEVIVAAEDETTKEVDGSFQENTQKTNTQGVKSNNKGLTIPLNNKTSVAQGDDNSQEKKNELVFPESITQNDNGKTTKAIVENATDATKGSPVTEKAIANNEDIPSSEKNTSNKAAIVEQPTNAVANNSQNKLPNFDGNRLSPELERKPLEQKHEEAIAETATDEKPSLEEVVRQQELEAMFEETETDEAIARKWRIGPKVAPVYFNTLENGSPIHSQFAGNTKTGDVNMSYGINVAYTAGKRFNIRSGVNLLTVGYGTEDVVIQPEVNATALPTLNYAATARNISVSATTNARQNINTESLESNIKNTGSIGTMNQQMSYVEVPLEMSYALINKKFGVSLIAGGSTLFLTDNSVTVDTESLTTEVGEANNLNSISFSANAGIGIDYNVSDKIQLNVEPVFKYQLNTFASEDGNFRPYQLGVYTGFSFKF